MKKIIITMILSMISLMAYGHELYIEQVGSSSTVTITQQGTDNTIGTNIIPLYIGSGSNTVTIDQVGTNNSLTGVINGSSTDVTVATTGDNNMQEINCGTLGSASCSGSTITQTITGDSNTVIQNLGSGANHTSHITVTGDSNSITHTSTNIAAVTANIIVTGNSNTVGLTQSGSLPKTVSISTTGNNNTLSVSQSN